MSHPMLLYLYYTTWGEATSSCYCVTPWVTAENLWPLARYLVGSMNLEFFKNSCTSTDTILNCGGEILPQVIVFIVLPSDINNLTIVVGMVSPFSRFLEFFYCTWEEAFTRLLNFHYFFSNSFFMWATLSVHYEVHSLCIAFLLMPRLC